MGVGLPLTPPIKGFQRLPEALLHIGLARQALSCGSDRLVAGGGGETQTFRRTIELAGAGDDADLGKLLHIGQQSPDLALTHTYNAPSGMSVQYP